MIESGEERLRQAAAQNPADQELRRRGYSIHNRLKNKPAVWSKNGKLYCQVHKGCILLEQQK